MRYEDLDLKRPIESENYKKESDFVIFTIKSVLEKRKREKITFFNYVFDEYL